MKKVEHDLITEKYTYVTHEDEEHMEFNAPHHFKVYSKEHEQVLGEVNFQSGAIKESRVNGVMDEDLIAMVITRLQYFQNTKFVCRENAMAITKLEESLMWMRKRTVGREKRGVEGTHEK